MATKADLEQLFRQADVDGNNYLTLEELCTAMRKLGYKGDDSVIKVISAILLQNTLFHLILQEVIEMSSFIWCVIENNVLSFHYSSAVSVKQMGREVSKLEI